MQNLPSSGWRYLNIGTDMVKKKKSNGASPSSGSRSGPKTSSSLLGGMLSNAGVAHTEVPQASAEVLVSSLGADMPSEERTRLEQEARQQLEVEVARLQSDRDDLDALRVCLEKDAEALKIREEAIEAEKEKAKSRVESLAEKETRLLEKVRDLEGRELNARNGFSKQNEESLKVLRAEVEALELRKLTIIREADRERSEARRRIQEELELGLASIKSREDDLDRQQIELDSRVSDLEAKERKLSLLQRSREDVLRLLRKEVEVEFADDIKRRDQEIVRAQSQLERLRLRLDTERERFDAYGQLVEVLDGREPASLREELEELRRKNRDLNSRLSELETAEAIGDLDRLRDELAVAREQIRDLRQELEERKVSAHQHQLVVLEREQWMQEKRVLERTKQLLDGHIRDLESRISSLVESQQADVAFPELVKMDNDPYQTPRPVDSIENLKNFTEELQHRIAVSDPANELFFRLEDLQLFVGGLAMSQLHVFQGISGTGKTSLAKAFAKAVGGECQDIAVQAGWRDRSDLLGHYNAFEKRFSEKEALQAIYRALTPSSSDRFNIVLLDEMNLSRPEQYFADFLSALEKSMGDRWIRLMESAPPNAPRLLRDGREIQLPQNLWFIGTANQDETTNELADKTHDRAFVLELPRHENSFSINRRLPTRTYSFRALQRAFMEAQEVHCKEVTDLLGFVSKSQLSSVLDKEFGIGWGNRFERQAKSFLPVVKACGGTFSGALDHLLSTRIFRAGKVVGRYDISRDQLDTVEQALLLVFQEMSRSDLPLRCVSALERDRKRMERGA